MTPIDSVRKLPRLVAGLTFVMPDGWHGDVVDLSAAGMRVQSLVSLEPPTVIEGVLVMPGDRRIPLRAEVVWSTPPDHTSFVPAEMGLELLDAPAEYLVALAQLFAQ